MHTEEHDVLQLFDGQDAISVSVAAALAGAVGLRIENDEFGSRDALDSEAYDLFLRGRHIWHRGATNRCNLTPEALQAILSPPAPL